VALAFAAGAAGCGAAQDLKDQASDTADGALRTAEDLEARVDTGQVLVKVATYQANNPTSTTPPVVSVTDTTYVIGEDEVTITVTDPSLKLFMEGIDICVEIEYGAPEYRRTMIADTTLGNLVPEVGSTCAG